MNKAPLTPDHNGPEVLERLWKGVGENDVVDDAFVDGKDWVFRRTPDIKSYYTLANVIGIPGQYGTVICCTEKATGDEYAVKKINKLVYNDNKIRSLFFKDLRLEVIIMEHARGHENIVEIYEVFEEPKYLYIVMEKLVGGELYDYLQQKRPLSEAKAAEIFAQQMNAIYYLHSLNIVHCDIKPENFVFLTKEQKKIKCIDFGMSKIFRWRKYFNRMNGTPYYVAPEVLKGQYNEGSDMWSLGVCLFILVFGVPPFFQHKAGQKTCNQGSLSKNSKWFSSFRATWSWSMVSSESKIEHRGSRPHCKASSEKYCR